MTFDPVLQFKEVMASHGLNPPENLVIGRLARCRADEDRNGKKNGAYLLYLDGLPSGGFQNWKDGLGWQPWRAEIGRPLTKEEKVKFQKRAEAQNREREAKEEKRRKEAGEKARRIWSEAKSCPDGGHPYLTKKAVKPYGVKLHEGGLAIPLRDTSGVMHSLQFIDENYEKRFLTNGQTTGHYFSIGRPNGILCLVEGFATGASIHEATGHAVAVAFHCGNLLPVAKVLRKKFSGIRIIVCADDDWKRPGNPGLTKANEATQAIGGFLAIPDFGSARTENQTDFNDLHISHGLEAVRRCINVAKPVQKESLSLEEKAGLEVNLIRGSEVKIEPVHWLWDGWLASGKMHILAGDMGAGKTTIALAIAATITSGGRWPDGSSCERGNVLIWSGEDDPGDTLAPRLVASGADMDRVFFVAGVREGKEKRNFDPASDMEALKHTLSTIEGGITLIIVDPIVSAVAGDSHKNAETRRSLQPLVDIGTSCHCAVLGITHFSKNTVGRKPTDRVTGSLAFGAIARVVIVASKCKPVEGSKEPTPRLLIRAKNNNGPDDGGFNYELRQSELKDYPGVSASSVLWGGAIEGDASELLAEAEGAEDGALGEAKIFLTEILGKGPLPQKEIRREASDAGHSWATVRRAKTELGVEAKKTRMDGGWEWHLPMKVLKRCSEDAQHKNMSTFEENEHLRGLEGAHGTEGAQDSLLGDNEHLEEGSSTSESHPWVAEGPIHLDDIVGPSRAERKKIKMGVGQ